MKKKHTNTLIRDFLMSETMLLMLMALKVKFSMNVLRQLVKVIVEINNEKEIREYKVEDLKFKSRRRREKLDISDEELRQLEVLDKREGKSKLDDD